MVQTYQTSNLKLYYPKRTPQQTIGIILIVIGAVFLLAYGLGVIILVPGILLWYYGRESCPYCKVRGKIRQGRSDMVSQTRGFGIVTRTDVVTSRTGRQRQNSTVQRQERVPVIQTVTRVEYQCGSCNRLVGSRDYASQQEDFGSSQQQTVVQREIRTEVQKEVLKVPCKYCRSLLDPFRDRRCPNCGAVVGT